MGTKVVYDLWKSKCLRFVVIGIFILRDVLFWYNVKINGLTYQTIAFGNRQQTIQRARNPHRSHRHHS